MIKIKKKLTFEQINDIARKLGTFVRPGDVIVLIGDLGTGKTTFTQELARALGVKENLKSPTFNYVLEYFSGRLPLYHFDVYRITDPMEVYEIGYEDYIDGDGVSVIEWGDLIESELPKEYIKILFEHSDECTRYFQLSFVGNKNREKEMFEHVGFND